MIHFDLPKEKSSIIKVIGIGGGGSNAVNYMFNQQIDGVNFIICNTDAQAIAQSKVPNKIQLGPHLTQGLGAGANPEIGRQATEESLEEIKGILQVNTKMAFVTAGMGGGTGTGGAPIISQICKDLGILTVGIVTTPFAYEGKKRQQQAEEGINILKQYVDTLLVISNDKLRHQFGNLKMREAFAMADNVLATAAKCITDVINSTGQINVDFADVCTVMRNGGVAILGSAACNGENRAQKAIEEALHSPLLNDNDIRGAQWILININSSEGDHEFTMDEVEIIQNYLQEQAGDGTDVILGMGYDNNLDDKIAITLIATGFEHKDPFKKSVQVKKEVSPEKILMVLGENEASKIEAEIKEVAVDPFAPQLIDEETIAEIPMPRLMDSDFDLSIKNEPLEVEPQVHLHLKIKEEAPGADEEKKELELKKQLLEEKFEKLRQNIISRSSSTSDQNKSQPTPGSGGYLSRPSNIYSENKTESKVKQTEQPVANANQKVEDEEIAGMQLVIKHEETVLEKPVTKTEPPVEQKEEEKQPQVNMQDCADAEKKKAADRLQKLRNLSFNINASDPNNEFESVPAYIRRNMELYNTTSNVENFYSKVTVNRGDDNRGQISTINTFLDGKKPD